MTEYNIKVKQGADYFALVNVSSMDLSGATIVGEAYKADIANTPIATFTCSYISGGAFSISLPASATATLYSPEEALKPNQREFQLGYYDVKISPVSGSTFFPISGTFTKIKSNI